MSENQSGCPVAHDGVTPEGSESENPALSSPTPKTHRPRTNQDWWPNQAGPVGAARARPGRQPAGRGVLLQGGVRQGSTSRRSSATSPRC
ncbi:hypothetical protein G5V59_26270 [Nocardioides sp. W3-2-3]|uniref:hypothetical protein n=1 Tax=Nocardioides convexus TaxID=2712224 RepID=UPI0024184D5C|nr:hypothetical protein [Nocardioides convexus]NHA01955.1 hypothetical protein [Nocardioides convexus]